MLSLLRELKESHSRITANCKTTARELRGAHVKPLPKLAPQHPQITIVGRQVVLTGGGHSLPVYDGPDPVGFSKRLEKVIRCHA